MTEGQVSWNSCRTRVVLSFSECGLELEHYDVKQTFHFMISWIFVSLQASQNNVMEAYILTEVINLLFQLEQLPLLEEN